MRARELDCRRARDLLEAYAEGLLSARQSAAVSAHLRSCAECARELGQIEKVAAALSAVPPSEPSLELARQISARLADLPSPASRRGLVAGWHRLEVLAAACVAILACWHYAVPLLVAREAHTFPLVGWIKSGVASLVHWIVASPQALHDLMVRVQTAADAFGLTATALAPIVGLYAAAEIGIIAAVVLIAHRARRAARATLSCWL